MGSHDLFSGDPEMGFLLLLRLKGCVWHLVWELFSEVLVPMLISLTAVSRRAQVCRCKPMGFVFVYPGCSTS